MSIAATAIDVGLGDGAGFHLERPIPWPQEEPLPRGKAAFLSLRPSAILSLARASSRIRSGRRSRAGGRPSRSVCGVELTEMGTELADKTCTPCRGGIPPMSDRSRLL